MTLIERCPRCGSELKEKIVEKLLRGGDNLASVTVPAEVCGRCGERIYSIETARLFEDVRHKLATHEVEEFEPLGQSFRIPA